jgi:hypothetical protein
VDWCDGGAFYNGSATYQLDGKVLINGNWYSKMLHYEPHCQAVSTSCLCESFVSLDTTTKYIRQDTAQKKVWLYNSSLNSDEILYDFNLNVGDTIDSTKAYWTRYVQITDHWIVTSIDSILINGNYRQQFNYSAGFLPGSAIEGIGALHGLMYRPNDFEYVATLHYFSEDNRFFYCDNCSTDTSFWEHLFCHDFALDISEIKDYSFSISPNPAHDNFTITLNRQIHNGELKIYDVTGREIMEQKIHSQLSTVNCLFAQGIYFLVVVMDGERVVKKIVKE